MQFWVNRFKTINSELQPCSKRLYTINQLIPNAFKKAYAYRSNSFFFKNHLPEPEELEW